jgi:hypothetical protein
MISAYLYENIVGVYQKQAESCKKVMGNEQWLIAYYPLLITHYSSKLLHLQHRMHLRQWAILKTSVINTRR